MATGTGGGTTMALPATGNPRDNANYGLMAILIAAVIAVGTGFTIRARAQR